LVLVHEFAHALVSQARGIRVQDVTLFLFGGATRARVEILLIRGRAELDVVEASRTSTLR
jgi:hypothetical protein